MNSKYKHLVILICITIAATIGVQLYWNLRIYEVNQEQVKNQAQVSFDKAIDLYYSDLAKNDILQVLSSDSIYKQSHRTLLKESVPEHVWVGALSDSSIHIPNTSKGGTVIIKTDTLMNYEDLNQGSIQEVSIFKTSDSINLRQLTTKVMFSFQEKSIDLKKIDSLVSADLLQKNIDLNYGFVFENSFTRNGTPEITEYNLGDIEEDHFEVFSNSSFIPNHSELKMVYTTQAFTVISRMIGSIVLSLILSSIIVGCLLFLLRIIQKQKQLSEIKNDLISNITHEFKTPIATIAVALEGLQNFEVLKSPNQTQNYLKMSNEQLNKLHLMVEQLLNTASLNSNEFDLNFKNENLNPILSHLVHDFQSSNPEVSFNFASKMDPLIYPIDRIHFENAISNLMDNAVKYGGTVISVQIGDHMDIYIEDNGMGIPLQEQEHIFEQFYRIPTGNVHNVKGFGIGLYYTKKIIEKHKGQISILDHYKGKTVFKIQLAYGL